MSSVFRYGLYPVVHHDIRKCPYVRVAWAQVGDVFDDFDYEGIQTRWMMQRMMQHTLYMRTGRLFHTPVLREIAASSRCYGIPVKAVFLFLFPQKCKHSIQTRGCLGSKQLDEDQVTLCLLTVDT